MSQTSRTTIVYTTFIASLYAVTFLIFYFAATRKYVPTDEFSSVRLIVLILFIPIIIKYAFQLLFAPFYSIIESHRIKKGRTNLTPTVSVLIPAHNEEVGITKTITSVLETNYPNLEVIVINDGSTDSTHRVITELISNHQRDSDSKASIEYISLKNGGKARALNRGLKSANGEIVITIDADSVMDPATIKNMVKRFTSPKISAVAGNVIVGNRKKPIGLIQQLEYLYGFYFKRADSSFNAVYIIGGAAAAYRREILTKIGGFDSNIITEDIEISTRMLSLGYRTCYAADAVVYTEGPSTIQGLCSQRLRWKFGRLLTFYKHRNLFFSTQKRHNPYLSFFILPIAMYAEIILFFEGIMLTIFYAYTFYTNDFFPLVFVIILLTSVIFLQVLTDTKARFHKNLLLLAPAAWILFYVIDVVEYQALIRSIKRLVKKESLQWQKWARVGVFQNAQRKSPTVLTKPFA
jgi:poly-beta-1,6 N-acetyl-D-glucosamine synthase